MADTNITQLVINVMTKAQYDAATKDPNQFYLVTDADTFISDVPSLYAETAIADADSFPFYDTSASAHKKTSWSNIKSLLRTYFDGIYNMSTESMVSGWGFTKNNGTVTSVAVQMNGTTKGTVTSSGTINLGTVVTQETDPTVPSWAKQPNKPTYTPSEIGLGNVGNFKSVSTVANQGLTATEKSNARANIGAGTSTVSVSQTLTSGTEIGKLTINGTTTTLYAPSGSNGITRTLISSVTDKYYLLASNGYSNGSITGAYATSPVYMQDGELYSNGGKLIGASDLGNYVSFSQTLSSGTEIGKLTINGTTTTLYAPTESSGGSGYTLPTASSSTLGGIKVGSGLSISSGVLSVPAVTASANGLAIAPGVSNTTTAVASTYYVFATSGTSAVPKWYKLPSEAFANNSTSVRSSNSTSKLYLIGATSQSSSAVTPYSNSACYISSSCLYSNSSKVLTASDTSFTQTLTSGTEIGKIKIGGTTTTLYAPSGSSGGSSSLTRTLISSVTDKYYLLASNGYSNGSITGAYAASPVYMQDGDLYANNGKLIGASDISSYVSFSRTLTSGTEIGKLTINGTITTLYAPSGGSGGGSATWSGGSVSANVYPSVNSSSVSSGYTLGTSSYYWKMAYVRSLNLLNYLSISGGVSISGNYIDGSSDLYFNSDNCGTSYFSGDIDASGCTVYADYFDDSSDRELKNEIDQFLLSLSELTTLPLVHFSFKSDKSATHHVGTYAQDVQKLLPEIVHTKKDGTLSMDYGKLGTAASLSLAHIVQSQETRILQLEKTVEQLQNCLNSLTQSNR